MSNRSSRAHSNNYSWGLPSPILASLEYLRNQNAHLQGKRSRSDVRSDVRSDGGRVQNEVRRKSKGGCVGAGGGDGGSDPIVLSLDWRP